jgi:hypothetical protein
VIGILPLWDVEWRSRRGDHGDNLSIYFPTQNQTALSQRGGEAAHRRRDAGAGHFGCYCGAGARSEPKTFNMLLNSGHNEARRLRVISHREYPWDLRLISR